MVEELKAVLERISASAGRIGQDDHYVAIFLRDHGQALLEALDSQDRLVTKTQAIVLDIWQTWYGGAPEWTPGDNISDLLNQIANSLWGLPEFAKALDARVSATNAIDIARTKAGAGGGE